MNYILLFSQVEYIFVNKILNHFIDQKVSHKLLS